MFELPVWQISTTPRAGPGQRFAEAIASFGLLLTMFGCVARACRPAVYAVGLYITLGLLVYSLDIICQPRCDGRARFRTPLPA
jgi:hypothetical protein